MGPTCHVNCLRLAKGLKAQYQACITAMTSSFEPSIHKLRERELRLLYGLVSRWETSNGLGTLYLRSLPRELKEHIAKQLLREYATGLSIHTMNSETHTTTRVFLAISGLVLFLWRGFDILAHCQTHASLMTTTEPKYMLEVGPLV